MQIRPAVHNDLDALNEIDGTIDSSEYLHVERSGEGMGISFKLEPRPLRERLIGANRLSDDVSFAYRQIVDGHDEGLCLVAEHEGLIVGAMVAIHRPDRGLLEVVDVRIDFDLRREGLATAMLFQATQTARERECRALLAQAAANNAPANQLLLKCGFELSGLDTRRGSNHDLAREITTLIWYTPLD
jgi:L-amino acid N-acyltransferase YncA